MRRFWTLALSLGIAVLLGGEALAASAEVTRAFMQEDTLYTYVELTGNDAPITKAEVSIDAQTFPASGTLETVRQAGFPVSYLLLLDASTSMPGYREDITAYADALAQTAGEHTRFLLATFGRDFTLLEDSIAAEDLAQSVAQISYRETSSRLLGGINAALDYLEEQPRTGNELRDIVVLSDAVEYDAEGDVSYEALLERLTASDAMLHSVGFGGDETAQGSLAALAEASGGRHWAVEDGAAARSAAEALALGNGGLYVTSFDLSGCREAGEAQAFSITFASGADLVCRAYGEVIVSAGSGAQTPPAEETPAETAPPSEPDRDPVMDTAGAVSSEEREEGGEMHTLPPVEILAGAGILAALGVVLLVTFFMKRRKKGGAAQNSQQIQPEPVGTPGIYVRLEVLQGQYAGRTQEFTLSKELLIGRDPVCDIVFDDPAISRKNSRAFLAGGVVYLEDLGSQNGTSLNGAPIQMPSILRSGDEIAIGDTVFCLKF